MTKLPQIDFLSAPMQYRRRQASLKKEVIARALGLKNKTPKKIIDATAGLARDSFILATLGFEITLLERSPIIFQLIQDAMERAKLDATTAPIIARMHLISADSIAFLKGLKPENYPDIIYLDPMFPERKKSALPKEEMRLFHEIVGDDPDAEILLQTALTCAKDRVVVKRPRLAMPLAGLTPNFAMKGSSSRFDIYLIRESHGKSTRTS